MALDPKATPEEEFKAWLAEHEADLATLPRHSPARPPYWAGVVLLLTNLFIWVVMLSNFGANIRQLLRALRG